jgi:hypothetical protein
MANKRPALTPKKRILIACEGQKTEPTYLKKLCDFYNIDSVIVKTNGKAKTALVVIDGTCGSSPSSVAEYAKAHTGSLHDFDHIFCVFDRDQHTDYQKALNIIKKNKKIAPITSDICFELWILLHFTNSTKSFTHSDAVVKEIKTYIPNYEKGQCVFDILKDKTDTALSNAKHYNQQMHKTNNDAHTKMGDLVEILKNLNK